MVRLPSEDVCRFGRIEAQYRSPIARPRPKCVRGSGCGHRSEQFNWLKSDAPGLYGLNVLRDQATGTGLAEQGEQKEKRSEKGGGATDHGQFGSRP